MITAFAPAHTSFFASIGSASAANPKNRYGTFALRVAMLYDRQGRQNARVHRLRAAREGHSQRPSLTFGKEWA